MGVKSGSRVQRDVAGSVLCMAFAAFMICLYGSVLFDYSELAFSAIRAGGAGHDGNSDATGVSFAAVHRKHYEPAPERTPGVYRVGGVSPANTMRADLDLRRGSVYSARDYAKMHSYTLVRPEDMDEWRGTSPSHFPRHCTRGPASNPWLIEFRGVWMTVKGDILVPERMSADGKVVARHYAFGGGICREKWGYVPGGTVILTWNPKHSVCRHRLAFSLVQFEGTTYYHVMTEVLPRFFAFWKAAWAVLEEGGELVSIRPVVQAFLRSLGVRPEQLASFQGRCYFDRLLIPEPFYLGAYPHQCHSNATQSALRYHFLADMRLPESLFKRPIVLFIERASQRFANGTCAGSRCLANLPQLRQAVARELGDLVEVQTFHGNESDALRTAARMFHRATVVVGVHGAGLTNIIYMRGPGTSLIELANIVEPVMYAALSHKYRVDYRKVLAEQECHDCENLWADIPSVILEVRRALARAGMKLPPPVLNTNATRNAELVWLSPCRKTPLDLLERQTLEQCPSVKGPDIQAPYSAPCNTQCARFLRLGHVL